MCRLDNSKVELDQDLLRQVELFELVHEIHSLIGLLDDLSLRWTPTLGRRR